MTVADVPLVLSFAMNAVLFVALIVERTRRWRSDMAHLSTLKQWNEQRKAIPVAESVEGSE